MTQQETTYNELALPPGFVLGDYIIRHVLGNGGFGITYLASDRKRGEKVVIKENLPPMFAVRRPQDRWVTAISRENDDFAWTLNRFIQEAEMLTKLSHRNIVRVTRVFQALGTAYYVMPYVGGRSLDDILKVEGPMPEKSLRPLLHTLLETLSYIHGKNILHRDIKPSNIMISETGIPFIIDFGMARNLNRHSQTVIESPGYTPFEQMQTHGTIGPWSDVYALGGTMYKLITGTTPMRSTDRVGHDTLPRLSDTPSLCRRYSRHLLGSIDRALAIDIRQRWRTAEEWMQALTAKREEAFSLPHEVFRRSFPPTPENDLSSQRSAAPAFRRILSIAVIICLIATFYIFINRNSLLHDNALDGNEAMVTLVLALGADIEDVSKSGRSALIQASEKGHEHIVRLLLRRGAYTESRDSYGKTALMWAAHKGHESVVRLLLEKGANPDARSNDGTTAADFAATDRIRALLERPVAAPLNPVAPRPRRDNDGQQLSESQKREALINAVYAGEIERVRTLIERQGANADSVDDDGRPVLFLAARQGSVPMVKLLLDKGANIEATAPDGSKPLHIAAHLGTAAVVQLLLERGANPASVDNRHTTPLHYAAMGGHDAIVERILDKGVNTEIRNSFGYTPLFIAVSYGHKSVVQLLLKKGADINAEDNYGCTPLDAATWMGREDMASFLREKGARGKYQSFENQGPETWSIFSTLENTLPFH